MTRRTKAFYDEAISYNKKHAIIVNGFTSHKSDTKDFAKDVSDFQKENELEMDGKLGPSTASYIRQSILDKQLYCSRVTEEDLLEVAKFISSMEGHFWSCNRDGEFRGLFDRNGHTHWASGKVHIGLSFGFIQFTQDGGALGELLEIMHNDDPKLFASIFGPSYKELLEVTNRNGRTRKKGRSPRVQPVAGHDLWDDFWVNKFIKAGKELVFQRSQLKLANKNYMTPAIKLCIDLGLSSQRALAMVFDRCVQLGPAGARRAIMNVRGEAPEHIFLKELVDLWKTQRWYKRPLKIYTTPLLKDERLVL